MVYKGQSSYGITAILYIKDSIFVYIYQDFKTLFGSIKPTKLSVWMAYEGQSSIGKRNVDFAIHDISSKKLFNIYY